MPLISTTTKTLGAGLLCALTLAAPGDAQLDESCIVSTLNRSAPVQYDGTWVLPNVPSSFGSVRVRATCVRDGVMTSGVSDLVEVPANGVIRSPDIRFDVLVPIPERLVLTTDTAELRAVGEQVQVNVIAHYPDGTTRDVSAAADGTSYTTSSGAALINADGLATAQESGVVLVSATHEGVLGLFRLTVITSEDSDEDGIPDEWEVANGLDPNDLFDAFSDRDQDQLIARDEFLASTDPNNPDTDGDTLLDGIEGEQYATDPALFDTDGDLFSDGLEVRTGSDPLDPSSYNLADALAELSATPASLLLVYSTLDGETSRQVNVSGTLLDGTVLDLTPYSWGTQYFSSDLNVCNFGGTAGEIFAGANGECVLTVTNSGWSAAVAVSVESFDPVRRAALEIPGFANDVDVDGDFVFVAAGYNGLHVVDVHDRDAPFIAATLDTAGNANDVRVVDGVAWIADGEAGLVAVDVREPTSPLLLGTMATAGSAMNVAVDGSRVYVADGPAGLAVVDGSDTSSPVLLGCLEIPDGAGGSVGVDAAGNLAVVTAGDVFTVDVTDPSNPVLLGILDADDARDVALNGTALSNTVAWVADGLAELSSIDLTAPDNPVRIATVPFAFSGWQNDVALRDDFAFLPVRFAYALAIIDVLQPAAPSPRFFLDFGSAGKTGGTGIAVDPTYAYFTTSSTSLDNQAFGTTHLTIAQYRAQQDDGGVPPSVAVTAPADGSEVVSGKTLQIRVEASDDVGVFFVNFLVDGEIRFRDDAPPFVYGFPAPLPGSLMLTAEAVDFGGNRTLSAPVTIHVVEAPATSVVGAVVDPSGAAVADAAVLASTGGSTASDAGGLFQINNQPTDQGDVVVFASKEAGGLTLRGRSEPASPVAGGFTYVGTVTVQPAGDLFPGRKHRIAPQNADLLKAPQVLATGDFNGDGITDIVAEAAERTPYKIAVLLGRGNGAFETARLSNAPWRPFGDTWNPNGMAVGDFNGDGFDDVAVASWAVDAVAVFLSLGDGYLASPVLTSSIDPSHLASADFNGDGYDDIVVSRLYSSYDSHVLTSAGDGTFTSSLIGGGGFLAVDDWNGDGHADVIVHDRLHTGRGDSTFEPAVLTGVNWAKTVRPGDFNQDGIRDAVYFTPGSLYVVLGHGDGTFEPSIYSSFPRGNSPEPAILEIADVDGDGLDDAVVATRLSGNDIYFSVYVLRGDGTGRLIYSNEPPWRLTFNSLDALIVGDVHEDGLADVLLGTDGGVSVYRSHGPRGLDGVETRRGRGIAAVADVNGDGLVDHLGRSTYGRTIALAREDGTFELVDVPGNGTFSMFADLDGDGVVDLLTMDNYSRNVSVAPGLGDGTFPEVLWSEVTSFTPENASVTDFDGDTLPDLVVLSFDDDVAAVFINQGDGSFIQAHAFDVGTGPRNVAAGDWNSDGWTDLATTNFWSADVSLVLSRGDGSYEPAIALTPGPSAAQVAALDADGDGWMDLAVTTGTYRQAFAVLLRGLGNGTFSTVGEWPVGRDPSALVAFDLDVDGIVDLMTLNQYSDDVSVLLGRGDGTFAAEQRTQAPLGALELTRLDWNGDGLSDAVVHGSTGVVFLARSP